METKEYFTHWNQPTAAPTCHYCGKPDAGTVALLFCSVECWQAYQAEVAAALGPLTVQIVTLRERKERKQRG